MPTLADVPVPVPPSAKTKVGVALVGLAGGYFVGKALYAAVQRLSSDKC